MKPPVSRWSRSFVSLLVASVVGSLGLLAEPAQADKALFRVQRTFLGAPFPAVTSPGGAGRYQQYVQPYVPYDLKITMDLMSYGPATGSSSPPGVATVAPSNPIGSPFTLQKSFIQYTGTTTLYPSTAFTGYLSRSELMYVNGEARFLPNNPNGATMTTTVAFTGTPTTTHGGLFDFSRKGSMKIDPGPNRFGGTMRLLYDPSSFFYQYISYFAPSFFKGYGSFGCTKMGVTCTEGFETELGEVTSSGMVSRFLLDPTQFTYPTPTTMGKTKYRKVASPPAVSKNYYLHLNVPFTTGKGSAYNSLSTYLVTPQSTGYDVDLGGTDVTITRTVTTVSYKGKGKTYYPTSMYFTKLPGVTRVVSLVRPRLTQTYQIPRLVTDPIITNFQAARMQVMRVFFLPEPGAMLLIGSGIAGLAALALLRRR